MSKEIIYIDVNDDITSVVDKIKQSPQKVVALVPPKQTGLLQSVVNLQLLARASKAVKKYIVIITSRESLMKLAATAKIPVAKSLQSKPVLLKAPVLVDEDDLIDGSNMAVGEIVEKTSSPKAKVSSDEVIDNPDQPIELDDKKPDAKMKISKDQEARNKKRNKIIFASLAGVLLVAGLIWALIFAPRAVISISTRTKLVNVEKVISLVEDSSKADNEQGIVHAQSQSLEKKRTVEFAATGDKNVGERASARVKISNSSRTARKIDAGSVVKIDQLSFVFDKDVVVPSATLSFDCPSLLCVTVVETTVYASESGTKYNGKSGSSVVNGMTLDLLSTTAGGTDKMVKVVTKEDIEQATQKLKESSDQVAINELKNKFDASSILIQESLKIVESEVKSSVEVGKEAPNDKASLEQAVKYSMVALVRSRIVDYINFTALAQTKDATLKQKVYETGDERLQFTDFTQSDDGKITVKILTQTKIGPEVDIEEVREFAKGKTYGQIQDKYESIEGIEKVSVEFYPIWVRSVPNDLNKIAIKLNSQ